MTRKLSKIQIEHVQAFISKRGFNYTDLSLEILDHVACKVEEKLNEDPELSFENALRKTHAEFGVMGFSILEESFTKSLNRKYKLVILRELKTWFHVNHIVLLVGFFLLFFGLTKAIPFSYLAGFATVMNITLVIYYFLLNNKSFREFKKMLAIKVSIGNLVAITVLVQIWLQSALLWSKTTEDSAFLYIFNILFPLLFLINILFIRSLFLITNEAIERCKKLSQQLHQ